MKKKIPFSLDYKEKIESGEVSVVTKDGNSVRIICWDANAGDRSIVGLVSIKGNYDQAYFYNEDGKLPIGDDGDDLYLLVEDEELTEFEKDLLSVITTRHEYAGTTEKYVKEWAEVLLGDAKRQLESESECCTSDSLRYAMRYYNKGKKDALKDMPKWKRHCKREDEYFYLALKGEDWYLCCRGYMINVRELFSKLPKEGEE